MSAAQQRMFNDHTCRNFSVHIPIHFQSHTEQSFKQPNIQGIKIIRISQNLIKTIIEVINFTTFRQSFEFWN